MAYQPEYMRNGIYRLREGNPKKNLILIHGLMGDHAFNREDDQMMRFYEALETQVVLSDYTAWTLRYDTLFVPFKTSGQWLAKELAQLQGYDFSEAIVVGYSMGGLIGRVLTCEGFNYRYLVTIDTPHHGPVARLDALAWATLISPIFHIGKMICGGVDSLIWASDSQNYIQLHPKDQAKRKTSYAFYATDFRNGKEDWRGDDDTVPVSSQLALDAGDIRWRALSGKTYENEPAPGGHPHGVASRPEFCGEVLKLVADLLEGGTLPERKLDKVLADSKRREEPLKFEAPTLAVGDITAWYSFDADGSARVRLQIDVSNTGNRPVKLPLAVLFASNLGVPRYTDDITELMILPGKTHHLVYALEDVAPELQPENIELLVLGDARTVPLYYQPLPVDVTAAMPADNLWELGVKATAKARVEDDPYFTEVAVEITIDNPGPCTYYINDSQVDIRMDITPDRRDLVASESQIDTDKDVQIPPGKATTFKAIHRWGHGIGLPNKVSLRIGGKVMPVGEMVLECN